MVDPVKDKIAVAEAKRMGIPVVAMVDTNCNPDEIDHPIPSNDDAIRAIKLVCNKIAEAVLESKTGLAEVATEEVKGEGAEEAEVAGVAEPLIFTPEEE